MIYVASRFTETLQIETCLLLGNMKKVLINENIPNSLSNNQYKKEYLLERDEWKSICCFSLVRMIDCKRILNIIYFAIGRGGIVVSKKYELTGTLIELNPPILY